MGFQTQSAVIGRDKHSARRPWRKRPTADPRISPLGPGNYQVGEIALLGQWLNGLNFWGGLLIFSRENKVVQTFFVQGPKWLSEKIL